MNERTAPIVVEGAMECETDTLFDALQERRALSLGGFPAAEGIYAGQRIIVARTKIGLVNAAALTALLIERCSPRCIISQGTAGAHSEALHPGDIVLGARMVDINSCHMHPADITALEQLAAGEWEQQRCYCSDPSLLSQAEAVFNPAGRLLRGTIGSGSFWSHGSAEIGSIRRCFGTDCEEMETFGAAQVSAQLGVPFLGLRIISNNELTGEAFAPDMAGACQRYVLSLLQALSC